MMKLAVVCSRLSHFPTNAFVGQNRSASVRHPSSVEEGTGKRCSECGLRSANS